MFLKLIPSVSLEGERQEFCMGHSNRISYVRIFDGHGWVGWQDEMGRMGVRRFQGPSEVGPRSFPPSPFCSSFLWNRGDSGGGRRSLVLDPERGEDALMAAPEWDATRHCGCVAGPALAVVSREWAAYLLPLFSWVFRCSALC